MKKCLKFIFVVIFVLCFSSCKNNNDKDDALIENIEYTGYPTENIEKLESYIHTTTLNDIVYKTTYFFENSKCVIAKKEITFKSEKDANNYYKNIINDYTVFNVKIEEKTVSLYERTEYFDYYSLSKKELIDLLKTND